LWRICLLSTSPVRQRDAIIPAKKAPSGVRRPISRLLRSSCSMENSSQVEDQVSHAARMPTAILPLKPGFRIPLLLRGARNQLSVRRALVIPPMVPATVIIASCSMTDNAGSLISSARVVYGFGRFAVRRAAAAGVALANSAATLAEGVG